MVTIQTDLGNLKEPARRQRFEPTGNRRRTQGAIQQVDTVAAGKVAQVGMVLPSRCRFQPRYRCSVC